MKLFMLLTLCAAALLAQPTFSATASGVTLSVVPWTNQIPAGISAPGLPTVVTGTWITACTPTVDERKVKSVVIVYKSGMDVLTSVEDFKFILDSNGSKCGNVMKLIQKGMIISLRIVTDSVEFASID